jgi:hypothetical protein
VLIALAPATVDMYLRLNQIAAAAIAVFDHLTTFDQSGQRLESLPRYGNERYHFALVLKSAT